MAATKKSFTFFDAKQWNTHTFMIMAIHKFPKHGQTWQKDSETYVESITYIFEVKRSKITTNISELVYMCTHISSSFYICVYHYYIFLYCDTQTYRCSQDPHTHKNKII